MQIPILVLDFDISSGGSINVPSGTKLAQVLVRWDNVPIGLIEVPVNGNTLSNTHLIQRIQDSLYYEIEKELIRRAIIKGTNQSEVRLEDYWSNSNIVDTNKNYLLTIIVCTRDRPADLMRCLNSILALKVKPHEVLVVDSASSNDLTKRVVIDHFPSFRYIRETCVGLDIARNRGIRESSGEVLAFTDDDVIVDPSWSQSLIHQFSSDDSLGLVTGLIIPDQQETEAQVWFERYGGFGRGYSRTYVKLNPGSEMHWTSIGAGQLGAGANMAIRKKALADVGLFDPALDVGTSTLGGGDHEMFFRFLKSGWGCLYDPTVLVRHRHRRTMEELERLLYNYGYATRCFFERTAQNFPEDRLSVARLARWWWIHWGVGRLLKSIVTGGSFPIRLIWCEIKGYFKGRKGYTRARSESNIDESQRPDKFTYPQTIYPKLRKVGIEEIHIENPLTNINKGIDFEEIEIVVFSKNRPIGSVRLPCFGSPISRNRLADAIVTNFSGQILASISQNNNFAWAKFYSCLCEKLNSLSTKGVSKNNFFVSVVVTTCNRPELLRKCLVSLSKLLYPGKIEIVVVDNRPNIGDAVSIVSQFPGVRLVTEARRGSSFARNSGIIASRGEIIAMIDDDMQVSQEWLINLVLPFERSDVFAVTGNTLAGKLETSAELVFEQYGGFCRGMTPKEYSYNWLYKKCQAAPTWEIGGSGNAAFRKSIFNDKNIGNFTEILGAGVPAGVGEDTLMFYQIIRAGGTICYEPSAIAWHYHRVSDKELRRQIFAYSKGHVAYHLVTMLKYNDLRAISRIFYELPKSLFSRCLARGLGRDNYPWLLLSVEILGTLLGPISLIQSFYYVFKERQKENPYVTGEDQTYAEEDSNFEPNS